MGVAVVSTQRFDIAQWSRAVREHVFLDGSVDEPDRLIDLLQRRAGAWAGALLLPTEDSALEVLARHRHVLGAAYRVACPAWPVVQRLLHKERLTETAETLGVDVPRRYTVETALADPDTVRFPVVVKPQVSHRFVQVFQRKVHVARDAVELGRALDQARDAGLAVQIQEWIPGGDERFYNYSVYLDREGRACAECAMHKIRKSPPFFGVCRVAELASWDEPMQRMREATLRLLAHVGWRGMANAEFKLDPRTGRPVLMEINGRCFLMHAVALQAGVNYPWLTWQEAASGQVPAMAPRPWDGAWIHLHADLLYFLFFARAEGLTLRGFLAPYRRRRAFAVWSARDPAPFVAQWLHSARDAARLLVRRRDRSRLADRVQNAAVPGHCTANPIERTSPPS